MMLTARILACLIALAASNVAFAQRSPILKPKPLPPDVTLACRSCNVVASPASSTPSYSLDMTDLPLRANGTLQYQMGIDNLNLGRFEQAQPNAMAAAHVPVPGAGLRDPLQKQKKWGEHLVLLPSPDVDADAPPSAASAASAAPATAAASAPAAQASQ